MAASMGPAAGRVKDEGRDEIAVPAVAAWLYSLQWT
jgi:hypothetical protein